ncbi:uncharacterized protein M8220_016414 isoform 1-T5 [Acridotheres tristis]
MSVQDEGIHSNLSIGRERFPRSQGKCQDRNSEMGSCGFQREEGAGLESLMDLGSTGRQELNKLRERAAEKEKMGSASLKGCPRLKPFQMCWKFIPRKKAPNTGGPKPRFDVHAQELGCSCAFLQWDLSSLGSAKGTYCCSSYS